MDLVKEAFVKVKQDIFSLQKELFFVRKDIEELKNLMGELVLISKQALIENEKSEKVELKEIKESPTQPKIVPTDREKIPTDKGVFNLLKHQNQGISIGNEGVPTDRQTNQQTDKQVHFSSETTYVSSDSEHIPTNKGDSERKRDSFEEAIGVLESLDNIKKELRIKFKKLTDQEVLVFSTLYQIEEEKGYADYKTLSIKLSLTESSIRDYIGKLIKKGIPLDKIKINNKSVQLKISQNLKKIATLSTILALRDI